MDLELLVNNRRLLTAHDSNYPGRTVPLILVDGVMNVDVHRITVSTLS